MINASDVGNVHTGVADFIFNVAIPIIIAIIFILVMIGVWQILRKEKH